MVKFFRRHPVSLAAGLCDCAGSRKNKLANKLPRFVDLPMRFHGAPATGKGENYNQSSRMAKGKGKKASSEKSVRAAVEAAVNEAVNIQVRCVHNHRAPVRYYCTRSHQYM